MICTASPSTDKRHDPDSPTETVRRMAIETNIMSDPIPDCPLLQKLPAELRLMIWEFTIGHQYIHIRLKPKLGHTVRDPVIWKSKLPTAAFINDKASNNMSDPPRALDSFSLVSRKEHTVGGLFRACKQTHRESIKITLRYQHIHLHGAMASPNL